METESDENLDLDGALAKLDMLSTVTNARREYLNEMRLRGVRAVSNGGGSSWKYQRSEPSNINGSSAATFVPKDNFRQRSHSSCGLHNGHEELPLSNSGSNSHLNKLLYNRHRSHHHSRISPYGYWTTNKRRPLNALSFGSSTGSTSTSTTSSGSTSSVNSTNTEDNNGLMIASAVTSFTHFLKEHQKLQRKYLEQLKPQELGQGMSMLPGTSSNLTNFYTPLPSLLNPINGFGNPVEDKRLKITTLPNAATGMGAPNASMTDDIFPVPNLTRSKSLEDLRECIKPKPKSLSSYFCGNSNNTTLDASSLSPRNNYCDLSAFHQTFQQPPNVEAENLIKNEIDSMSMRIGNLDVG